MVKKIARYFLESHVLKGSAAAFALKFTASVAGFTMFALASRSMEPASFGSLAIIFNAMSFLSVVALCGQETLIVRSWNEYCGSDRPALARGVLTFGGKWCSPSPLAWLVVAAPGPLGPRRFARPGARRLRVSVHALPHAVHRSVLARCRRRRHRRDPARIPVALFVVVALLAHHALDIEFGATEFLLTSAAALFFAIMVQLWRVAPSIPAAVKRAQAGL